MQRFTTTIRFASFVCLVFVVAYCTPVAAQDADRRARELSVATKFDEYGYIGGCDHSARLDNFTILLQGNPTIDGYILIYGPPDDGPGSSKRQFDVINDYLVNARGLAADRIKFIHGGRNRDLKTPKIELWLAPQGAKAPQPEHFDSEIETFNGKFDDSQAGDEPSLGEWDEPGMGPPIGDVTLASFADMLRQQKQTIAYIVAYNGPAAVPGAWQRVAARNLQRLKERGVDAARIKVIFGGIVKQTRVQLWILPPDAPPPVIDAGVEALPQKAVQRGTFSDYMLGNEENQREAFNELVNILRLNDKLRACIIVRLEAPSATDDEVEETAAPATEPIALPSATGEETGSVPHVESPPADFPKLIEKWTAEFAALKFKSDRLVVLFVPAREWEGASLETWIVPAGFPLPDPFAEPEAPEEEDEDQPAGSEKPPSSSLQDEPHLAPPDRIRTVVRHLVCNHHGPGPAGFSKRGRPAVSGALVGADRRRKKT